MALSPRGLAYGGPVNNLGATLIDTQRIIHGGAFMFEAVGTWFLITTVLQPAVRSPSSLAPVAIGMTITLCILGFGVVTGAAISPARTIGPAVAAGLYGEVPLYVAAQLVGAIFAGAMYRWFWLQPHTLADRDCAVSRRSRIGPSTRSLSWKSSITKRGETRPCPQRRSSRTPLAYRSPITPTS